MKREKKRVDGRIPGTVFLNFSLVRDGLKADKVKALPGYTAESPAGVKGEKWTLTTGGLSHLLLKFLPGATRNHIIQVSLPCKYERSEGQQEPEIMNNFQYRVVEDQVTCILNWIVSPT